MPNMPKSFMIMLAVLVSGCGRAPETPAGPQPLKIETDIKVANGSISIEGTSNLPEGTDLKASVGRTDLAFDNGKFIKVGSGGTFTAGPYDLFGRPLPPGKYQVEISTPDDEQQPDEVQPLLGKDYANFVGPMRVPGIVGMILHYETTATIEGNLSKQAAQKMRDARVQDLQSQLIENCKALPAESEQLTGRPSADPAGIVEKCIRDIKAIKPAE